MPFLCCGMVFLSDFICCICVVLALDPWARWLLQLGLQVLPIAFAILPSRWGPHCIIAIQVHCASCAPSAGWSGWASTAHPKCLSSLIFGEASCAYINQDLSRAWYFLAIWSSRASQGCADLRIPRFLCLVDAPRRMFPHWVALLLLRGQPSALVLCATPSPTSSSLNRIVFARQIFDAWPIMCACFHHI